MKYLTILSALLLTTLMACGGAASDAKGLCDCATNAGDDTAKKLACMESANGFKAKGDSDPEYQAAFLKEIKTCPIKF